MRILGIAVLPCALVPLVSNQTCWAEDGFVIRSVVPPGSGLRALKSAVMGARRRLERPECQRLFSEFSDASGRPLQVKLDALNRTGQGYLGLILFADASDGARCKARGPFAFTTPGSRVVFVCGARFKEAADQNMPMAEAAIIHEALHSLGLGEDPPSSAEITARVLDRCH